MSPAGPRLRRIVLGALAGAALAACGTTRTYIAQPTPYDVLGTEEAGSRLRDARVLADSGRTEAAHEVLAELVLAWPRNLRVSTFLQEAELALLLDGATVRGMRLPDEERGADAARALLYSHYLRRTEAVPTSEGYVLAARLAPDPGTAFRLLQRAVELDPRNPWAHYAIAWAHARQGDFRPARDELERALEVDPGHLPSIRLDGELLARAGNAGRAITAYRTWIERSLEDPSVDPRGRAVARLDLAVLLVSSDEPAEALDQLEAVEPGAGRDARIELVRASAYHALGDADEARRALRHAREANPDELLVPVHEALLASERGDLEAERAAWEEALAIAERAGEGDEEGAPGPADFRSLLVRLQALARLQRIGRDARP